MTPKSPNQRQLRVGEMLRHALSQTLDRGEVRDPDLRRVSITVTEVRVSPDLRNATAYVLPLGGGDAAHAVAALNRAGAFLRRQVAAAVRLKYAPDISFQKDETFDAGGRIEELLRDPRVARDLEGAASHGGADESACQENSEKDGRHGA